MDVLKFVHILTMLAATASGAALAPNGGWDASWSPDGKTIAFTAGSRHGIPNLWLISADGSKPRVLTTRGAHEPRWLPDGKTIVFGTVRNGNPAYMSISSDGKLDSEEPVAALPTGAEDPLWSPDGSLIAFGLKSDDGASRDLWFVRSDGGQPERLTVNFWVREWTWSPAGVTLALVIGKAAGTSIWTATPKNKDLRLLYKGFCRAPAYSPDGKRLALAIPDVRSGFKIVMIDLETGKDKLIGVRTFDGQKLIWSPNGSRLFFSSSRKSEPAVWSIASGGGDLERVTPAGTPARAPCLSADGTRLVFHAIKKGSYSPDLYTCDTSGKGLSPLTRAGHCYWSPVLSPDGKLLAFQADLNKAGELFVGPASGRRPKPIAELSASDFADVSWLPDGKRLLVSDDGRLFVVEVGKRGPAPKPILEAVQAVRLAGDELYFTEWNGWNAGISAMKLDGTEKRSITNKPLEKPAEPEPKKAEPQDARNGADAPTDTPTPATESSVPAGAASGPEGDSDGKGETGNPHSDLGVMGPMPDTNPRKDHIPVVDLAPAISPDGKLVAFLRNDQVWLVMSDGTGEKQLTQFPKTSGADKRVVLDPSWSPSGENILFSTLANSNGRLVLQIWLLRPEPGSEQLVYSENADSEYGLYYQGCTNPPTFTPDGRRIVFTSVAAGGPRIVSVNLEGSGLRELAPAPSSFPSMDASGKKLAYVDLSDSRERIRVLDIESGVRSRLLFE